MKKVTAIILVLSLSFIFATFTSCSVPSKGSDQPISIGVLPDVDSIPLIIARQNGYFEKEGIKVNIQSFKSALDRDSALQSSQIDGAVSDVLAAAFARDGGFDVRITSMTNGSYKLIAGASSGIKSIQDVKGKSIAISANTTIEYSTDVMLKESGLKSGDINKTVIPQIPVRLEMLQSGKVDAATLPEPLATVAVKNGAKLLGSTDKLSINPGILVFTKKSIDTRSSEIKAFYKAYNQAVEYLQKTDISAYIDVLIKDAGFPEDVKGSIVLPSYTKAALPSTQDVDSVVQWLKEKSLIKNTYKYEDLVDNKFVR